MRKVIGVTKVQIRRVKDGSDHRQIFLIFLALFLVQMQHGWNVLNNIEASKSPYDLVVYEANGHAMRCNNKMFSGY